MANLLALVRLKTEAALLGYESIVSRDNEVVFKLTPTVTVDRIGVYKRFRNEANVSLGQVRIPRRRFAEDSRRWLAELRELAWLIVGRAPKPRHRRGHAARRLSDRSQ